MSGGNENAYKTKKDYDINGNNCQQMVNAMMEAANVPWFVSYKHPNMSINSNENSANERGQIK